jgi:protease IV
MNSFSASPRRCSHVGFWIAISVLGVFFFASLILNMGLFVSLAARSGTSTHKAEDEFPTYTEKWSYGSGDVKTVRIAVEGPIFREREETFFGLPYDKVEAILRQIRAAKNDKTVQAILLEVDSPGGDLTASDEIYKALRDFKQSAKGRKIIVFVRNMAASGGYYVSMPADWIIAEPTSIIGSIGVILQTLNWKGLSDRIGLVDVTIKSGANKDLLNPFRDVSPEQVSQLQEMIDTMYQQFFTIVQTNRNIEESALKLIADGRIFSARAALQNRLIDQIGYWEDAAAKTADLLGEKSVKIVRYERRTEFFELLAGIKSPLGFSRALFSEAATPRMMYLWRP